MSKSMIQGATDKKIELCEKWFAQENEYNIVDVSFCAGQTIVQGKDDCRFAEFSSFLHAFMQQISALFPFITFIEKDFLHSTLLTIFNDNDISFNDNKFNLIKMCKEIAEDAYSYIPLIIYFNNIVLTSNGTIILLGESKELIDFRNHVYNKYPIPQSLRKNIVHITLGRLFQNESIENMSALNTFLKMKGSLSLPPLIINHPKIIVSRDMLCLNVDNNLTCEFNRSAF